MVQNIFALDNALMASVTQMELIAGAINKMGLRRIHKYLG